MIQLRTPRYIVLFLLEHPDARFKEILAEFRFTKGALSFHLKKLTTEEIVTSTRIENEICYRIKDEQRIRQVLVAYKAGFLDEAVSGFVDVWTKI